MLSIYTVIALCIAYSVPAPAARTLGEAANRHGFDAYYLAKGEDTAKCAAIIGRARRAEAGVYPNGAILYQAPLTPARADDLMLAFEALLISTEGK